MRQPPARYPAAIGSADSFTNITEPQHERNRNSESPQLRVSLWLGTRHASFATFREEDCSQRPSGVSWTWRS
jgi:hypothetical protein